MVEGAPELMPRASTGAVRASTECRSGDQRPGVSRHGAGGGRAALAAHGGTRADHAGQLPLRRVRAWRRPWSPSRRRRVGPRCGRPPSTCRMHPTGSVLDLTVTLAAVGRRVTQGRVVGHRGRHRDPHRQRRGRVAGRARGGRGVGDAAGRAPARRVPAPAAPRLHLHLHLRPHRRAPGPGADLRGDPAGPIGPGEPTVRCGPGCPGTSSRRRPPWPSSATT